MDEVEEVEFEDEQPEPEPEQPTPESHDVDEEEEEETNKKEEPKILTEEIAGQSLSLLCKSGDGLSHVFVRLDLKEKNLSDINIIQGYIHLRYIDLSNNRLSDLKPLNNLTHLLSLKADFNNLDKIELRSFPFLQFASFSFNKISDTSGLQHPLLEHLNLNHNQISSLDGLDGKILTKLHTLEMRENQIKSIEGLDIPSLKSLYIGYNSLTNLNGISRMKKLETLHARKNLIKELSGFKDSMGEMKYLNLRENVIENISEINKMNGLSSVKILSFSENPVCNEDDFRIEVLMTFLSLGKLNKDDVTEEEKLEALEMLKQRQLEKKTSDIENMDNFQF